jgi:hypothetical protein
VLAPSTPAPIITIRITPPFAGMTQSRFTGMISALGARTPRCDPAFRRDEHVVKFPSAHGCAGTGARRWAHLIAFSFT